VSIVVEDGTGLSTAESYASVATADAYHTAYGNTGWTGTTGAKEIALRRAAQYIDARYNFRGVRLTSDQALEWPRVGYEPDGRVEEWAPTRLVHATCEAALRALSDTLQEDVSADSIKREKVGEIEIEYGQKTGQTRYPIVDSLLRPYATSSASMLRVERVG
jgi:hypothetical protein